MYDCVTMFILCCGTHYVDPQITHSLSVTFHGHVYQLMLMLMVSYAHCNTMI